MGMTNEFIMVGVYKYSMISGIGLRVWENRVFLLPHQTLKDSLNRLQIVIL